MANTDSCRIIIAKLNIINENWKNLKSDIDTINEGAPDILYADRERLRNKWNSFHNDLYTYEDQIFPSAYDSSLIKRLDTLKENLKLVSDTVQMTYKMDTSFLHLIAEKADSIQKRTRLIDTTTKRVDTVTDLIKRTIYSIVLPNQDSLKYFMYKRDTTIKNILVTSAFQDGLYGIGYSRVLGKKNSFSPLIISGEILFPLNSQSYKNAGGFLSAGVQNKSMVFLAGIGYLNNNSIQNISWKGMFFYFPYKSPIGFGLNYSSITNIGISLQKKLGKLK